MAAKAISPRSARRRWAGLLILSALVFSTLVWARLDNPYVWITLLVTLAFGLIGFADDYAKVTKQNTKGVSGRVRMLAGLVIAALASYAAASFHPTALTNQLALPLFKDALINLSVFFVPFGMFVIVGAANAVNLTDGLDGLAIMPVMIAGATLGVIAYVVGNYNFSDYLGVHFVPGTGELADLHRRAVWRWPGVPVVQRPPGGGVHGRHRRAGLGRGAGGHCGLHQARNRAGHCRWAVRGRGPLGHHSGAVLQTHRQTGVPDGPDPPPFREERLGRTADRDPVLDHLAHPRDDRTGHAEGAVTHFSIGLVCLKSDVLTGKISPSR
jgi:hypothetical protein